jgi:hypothetical protein
MRVYINLYAYLFLGDFDNANDHAEEILCNGFSVPDEILDDDGNIKGVTCTSRPLGFDDLDDEVGPVLCIDVPDDLFGQHEYEAGHAEGRGWREANIPAAVLNGLGRPRLYDALYAGHSRRDLVLSVRELEALANEVSSPTEEAIRVRDQAAGQAREMRDAIAFFDRIGWLTPLRLREGRGDP